MKLIIDIPDDVYEDIEHCKGDYINYYINSLNWAVRNGIPYEERPQGKWVYVQYDADPEIGNWHCSNCRCMPWYSGDIHTLKYCPECGADMKGGAE